nr:Ig-like domain-containing protein [Gemmatimonadaceae bacterium]
MALQIEQQTRDIGVVRTPIGPERTRVVVRPGDAFRFVDDTGQPLVRAPGLRVRRIDNNLIIDGLPDGREIELNNFFGACRPGAECTVSLQGIGLPGAAAITEDSPPKAALADGSFLLYSDNTDSAALAALPVAKVADAAGPSWLAIGGAAAGIGIAAAAAGGGGGGGGGPVEDTTPPGAPVVTSGPVLGRSAALVTGEAEAGTRVTLRVDVNGNGTFTDPGDLTFSTTVDPQGRWSIDLNGTPQSGTPPAGGLVDGRPYVMLVQAVDAAQNASPATRTVVTLDGTAPPAPLIGTIAGDDVVNAAEVAAGLAVSGTGEAGGTVTVAIGDARASAPVGSNGAWSVTFQAAQLPASGLGTFTATVADAVGNVGPATTRQAVFEAIVPGAPVITDDAAGTAGGPVTFTLTFDRPITGFDAADIGVQGGTAGAFTAVSPTVYTQVVTPAPGVQSGQIVLTVPVGAGTDLAGNPTSAGAAIQAYDTAAPTVAVTNDAVGTVAGPVRFTFTFSEPVTGFTASDVVPVNGSVVGGSFGAVGGSTTIYAVQLAPTPGFAGTMSATVAAGAAIDAVGLPSAAGSGGAIVDLQPPTLSVTDNVGAAVTSGPITFTFTASEPISGFEAVDVVVSNAAVTTPLAQVGTSNAYTITVTPTAGIASGAAGVSVAAGRFADALGNLNTAAASGSQGIDTVAPTVAITDNAPGTASA